MNTIKEAKVKRVKRIKENVTSVEYKKLMSYIRGNESMREHSKLNLLRTFTILYYTGLRLNEVQELKIAHIVELLTTGTTKVVLSKTSNERKLYLTDGFKKDLLKVFTLDEDTENRVVSKGSNKSRRTGISEITYIQQVNGAMFDVLGKGFTSHSFRQGIITEMGSKGINVKIISTFIAHKNVKTTLDYITPTQEDIQNSLVR